MVSTASRTVAESSHPWAPNSDKDNSKIISKIARLGGNTRPLGTPKSQELRNQENQEQQLLLASFDTHRPILKPGKKSKKEEREREREREREFANNQEQRRYKG
jgi:hypothetical protein